MSNMLLDLRKELIVKTLDCVMGKSPKEQLIESAQNIRKHHDISQDTQLVEIMGFFDFLARQIKVGNNDMLTPALLQESYAHILDTLTPAERYRYIS